MQSSIVYKNCPSCGAPATEYKELSEIKNHTFIKAITEFKCKAVIESTNFDARMYQTIEGMITKYTNVCPKLLEVKDL